MNEASNRRITLNLFTMFGPLEPVKLHVDSGETLGNVKRLLSHVFKLSIHDEVILISKGRKLDSVNDGKPLEYLGISDGDCLIIGIYTPPLPSTSSFFLVKDVEIKKEALENCFKHAKKHSHVEVAGALIGREKNGGKILVVDTIPIAEGTPTSVILDPIKIANVANELRGSEDYIAGWYHSHIKSGPASMSGIDVRLQSGYKKLYTNAVALVLNHVKGTAEFYRVNAAGPSQPIGNKILNLPEPKLITMDSESITLTTILEKKEEAKITAFSGSDATCGSYAVFSVTVKNVGTVSFSKVRVIVHVTSPDGKNSTSTSSNDINLSPGESATYSLRCQIPASWSSGNAIARAGVRNTVTRRWLCSLANTSITLTQPPIHKVKLIVYRTSQRVNRGQAANYIVYVKNVGNRQDNIEIDWDLTQLPKLWKAKIYDGETEKDIPFNINLDVGATRKLILKVVPPATGYAGDKAPVTIKARPTSASAKNQREAP